VVASGIIILIVVAALAITRMHSVPEPKRPAEHALSPHDPIVINGPEDFTTPEAGFGCGCVRQGSGTQTDPYVIAGWVIRASTADGIAITLTSSHFVIRGVSIYGEGSSFNGITLRDVENGRIEGSTVTSNSQGIWALSSSNLAIIDNNVTDNRVGVLLEVSHKNMVQGNNASDNSDIGIFVRGSYNRIINNTVARNGFGGINIDGTIPQAVHDVVSGNIVTDNGGYGVGLWVAANSVVSDNTVIGNGEYGGIGLVEMSYNNTVTRNLVQRNSGNGISVVEYSSANSIFLNRANGNGDGVSNFDLFDDGSGSGNVWANNDFDTSSSGLSALMDPADVFHSIVDVTHKLHKLQSSYPVRL
jgi:parallel beta-helix repeat protein